MDKRNPQSIEVRPLEELHAEGDYSQYGQICWSLASQPTDTRSPGDVISVPCLDDEDGNEFEERFRLTQESIENISFCNDLKSHGVAERFPKEESGGEPTGPCPHGHQEAAFQFMMSGVRPEEPCPDCGEIPDFLGTSMSPSAYSEGPVKGIDGQEYPNCPKCGSDLLQLEGESLAKWGWKIVCLDCDWEIKQAESLDVRQYCDLMKEIKARVESINQLMDTRDITDRARVESVALQLRMLLENIVFSSLVSNKDVWRKSQRELKSSQNISNKLRELKHLHPDFYPKPIDLQQSAAVGELVSLSRGFLGDDDLVKVYGQLGNILHADNPLGKETDYRSFLKVVPEWVEQVKKLLECHKVYLFHHPDRFYLVKMFGDADGELICIPFNATASGKGKCAWPDCVANSERRYCEAIQRPWRECRLPELEPQQTEAKEIIERSGFDVPHPTGSREAG